MPRSKIRLAGNDLCGVGFRFFPVILGHIGARKLVLSSRSLRSIRSQREALRERLLSARIVLGLIQSRSQQKKGGSILGIYCRRLFQGSLGILPVLFLIVCGSQQSQRLRKGGIDLNSLLEVGDASIQISVR